MSQQQDVQSSNQEGRITFALSAYHEHQFRSLRRAAEAFKVPYSTLTRRHNGITHPSEIRNAQHKLTATEEQTIVQYILNLDSRGFAPLLCEVADIADKLLAVRGGEPVGKHWAERLVTRSEELKMAFNRAKYRQRIVQEDPEIIGAWFKLVEETKAKYGVHDDDVHDFNESGFQMGVIGTIKVVTGLHKKICSKNAARAFVGANAEHSSSYSSGRLKDLEKHVPNPFTRLDQGKYLHDRP